MNDATATAPAAAPTTTPAQDRTAKPAANGDERLIGDQAATAASETFGKLSRALSPHEQPLPSTGKTIEEMVSEMIRPLLKDWVDNNLPPLVERIVEREIRKLVRHAETE